MKIKIRRGLFETNSSSTHVLAIFTAEEFEAWKNGELLWGWYCNELIDPNKAGSEMLDGYSYDDVLSNVEDFDIIEYTTKGGDKIVAMGYERYE